MYRIKIEHLTEYQYGASVRLGTHHLMVRPREGHDIRVESSILEIEPDSRINWYRDIYGNSVATVTFGSPAERVRIYSEVTIQNYETTPMNFLVDEKAVQFPFLFDSSEHIDLMPYQIPCFPGDQTPMRNWCSRFWTTGESVETFVLLDTINRAIVNEFHYEAREEPGVQRPAETLAKKSGSCRDFATLFIEACRFFGLAARFVSGYLYNPTPTRQHGATHAWSEVYLPGAGWKGFDNTSAKIVGPNHIPCAVSRHPAAVPPVSGSFASDSPVNSRMSVTLKVAAA